MKLISVSVGMGKRVMRSKRSPASLKTNCDVRLYSPVTCPPQPMVSQTRAVLDRYAAAGGSYREVVLPDVGHSPHVERPQEFAVALLEHLDVPAEAPAGLT